VLVALTVAPAQMARLLRVKFAVGFGVIQTCLVMVLDPQPLVTVSVTV